MKDQDYVEEVDQILARLEENIKISSPTGKPITKTLGFNLPNLVLPKFEGDPTQWTSFWDIFKCSVHDNKDLGDIQKFSYLRGQLEGEAKQLLEGFKLESANYNAAVNLLLENYGQKERVKASLVTNLCELRSPNYNVEELKSFYASMESLLRTLDSMNVTREEMCATIILNKLPSPMKENIKRELKSNILKVEEIVKLYQTEVFSMEGAYATHIDRAQATATFSVSQDRTGRDRGYNFACLLCNKVNHPWFRCGQYMHANQKIKRAKQLQRCVGCMASDHGEKGCTNPKVQACNSCKGKHYRSL
ncbi:MAG: DUF1759 domain-containing protein, partial [Colwellia sp.]|nr:DUF1759 domain-containing protein [Colwellia sp.]